VRSLALRAWTGLDAHSVIVGEAEVVFRGGEEKGAGLGGIGWGGAR